EDALLPGGRAADLVACGIELQAVLVGGGGRARAVGAQVAALDRAAGGRAVQADTGERAAVDDQPAKCAACGRDIQSVDGSPGSRSIQLQYRSAAPPALR